MSVGGTDVILIVCVFIKVYVLFAEHMRVVSLLRAMMELTWKYHMVIIVVALESRI